MRIVCTSCGYVGRPKSAVKGNVLIEIVLWCAFLLPGLIYSIWRSFSRYKSCPQCGHTTIIPTASPMGRRFIDENLEGEDVPSADIVESTGYAVGRLVGKAGVLGRLFRKS